MILRPATRDDVAELARIWHDGWHDGHLGHVPADLVAVRTPDSFPPRITARLADLLVAELDDVVVGFVMTHEDEVEQVYVDGVARGSGVAAALLAAAAAAVRERGHRTAWLAVAAGNARARRFYEREGWRDDGEIAYPAPTATGSVDVVCRRLVLDLP